VPEGPTPIEGPVPEGPTPIEGPVPEGPTPIEGPPDRWRWLVEIIAELEVAAVILRELETIAGHYGSIVQQPGRLRVIAAPDRHSVVISGAGIDERALSAAAMRAGYRISVTRTPEHGYHLTRGSAV
jgi:hypothetical protein